MKTKTVLFSLVYIIISISCSKNIEYTHEYMERTSGRYLLNQDEVIEVFYDNEKLFLKWKGAEKIKPVIIDSKIFYMVEINEKMHFVQHPKTKAHYLSKLSKENKDIISYDYIKVEDSFKIPSTYIKLKDYDKALLGYLNIQKQDSTSAILEEGYFNNLGYNLIREKKYTDAVGIFKINVALYPKNSNVYDSLAEAYLLSGDSLQAYNNYKMAFNYDNRNNRAKEFVNKYDGKPKK